MKEIKNKERNVLYHIKKYEDRDYSSSHFKAGRKILNLLREVYTRKAEKLLMRKKIEERMRRIKLMNRRKTKKKNEEELLDELYSLNFSSKSVVPLEDIHRRLSSANNLNKLVAEFE